MRPRLILLLLIIVLLPLGLLAGVGTYLAREQRAIQQHELRELLGGVLAERDAALGNLLRDWGRELEQLAASVPSQPESLRMLIREEPRVRQAFLLDAQGRLEFPREDGEPTAGEREFLERTQPVWRRGELLQQIIGQAGDASASVTPRVTQQAMQQQVRIPAQREGAESGWYAWYWDKGSHFIYWHRSEGGRVLGFELDRARLLAAVITVLPQTENTGGGSNASPAASDRTRLVDANGEVLYQWGRFEPEEAMAPIVTRGLTAPLQAWRFELFAQPDLLGGRGSGTAIVLLSGMVGSGALLILLATYFYRESTREMREAAQRVNFVNQVSHELKTPLTNIRLYAELMETRLDAEADPQLRKHLDIITAESQRLSRLINNVLTFARSQRRTLTLRPQAVSLDSLLRETAERFRAPLARRGVRIELKLDAAEPALLDGDAIDQIVGNLLSNVEKYAAPAAAAATGAVMPETTVEISSARAGTQYIVTIGDQGPGISPAERERIFLPFHRLSNRLTDGVAGTGIGLTIARDLARMHGGELELIPAARGATFRLSIRPAEPAGEPQP